MCLPTAYDQGTNGTGSVVEPVLLDEMVHQKEASTSETFVKITKEEVQAQFNGILSRKQVAMFAHPDHMLLIILRDKVYDLTHWQMTHPGGHLTIRAVCGQDATEPFICMHNDFVEKTKIQRFHFADLSDAGELDDVTIAFRKLTDELKRLGWFKTKYSNYHIKVALYALLMLAVVLGVTCSENVYVHCLSGVGLALFWQQCAFLGHDTGHAAVTHDLETDHWFGLVAGNLLTGISIGWWKRSHNLHHVCTNSREHDPDYQHMPVFAYDPSFLAEKIFSPFFGIHFEPTKIAHALVRYQHIYYYIVMSVARFNLYIQSILQVWGLGVYDPKEYVWKRKLQKVTLVLFWTWLLTLTFQLPTWKSRFLFFACAHVFAGVLHVQITLSHLFMESYHGVQYGKENTCAFLITQLEHTIDIDCHPWMDWFHGGLQYQTEHHVWPRMDRHRFRAARDVLRAFCKQHDLNYFIEPSFLSGNISLVRHLREVGKTANGFSPLFQDSIMLEG